MSDFWHEISRPDRCFVIAEIGVNHNGSLEMARQLIDVAADAGADAVKFQTFFADELVTRDAGQAQYQIDNIGQETSQFEMLSKLELTGAEYAKLKAHCDSKGIMFLSTPFSERAADLLCEIGVDGFKVSSGDLTHIPLLTHLAGKELPVILSSGMATLEDVELALSVFDDTVAGRVALLHCVSDYPTAAADCNLRAMNTLRDAFDKPVGWSDHTNGRAIALAAVALGAQVLEKHYTLDRNLPGPDHISSLEPEELRALVAEVRMVEASMGSGIKVPTPSEIETAKVARRSVTLSTNIAAGTVLRAEHLAVRRPGTGIESRLFDHVIGRVAQSDLAAGTCLVWGHMVPLREKGDEQ